MTLPGLSNKQDHDVEARQQFYQQVIAKCWTASQSPNHVGTTSEGHSGAIQMTLGSRLLTS